MVEESHVTRNVDEDAGSASHTQRTTTTVEVGAKEYEVTVDEDGTAEAEPVSEGPYLSGHSGNYGFKIPLEDVSPETVYIERPKNSSVYDAAWDTSVDVSDRRSTGYSGARRDHLDGHASVSTLEIVDE